MNTLNRPRRSALHSSEWRKEFSTRQAAKYRAQDNRLHVPPHGSIMEEFFRTYNPSLLPPRHHEVLRSFLNQARTKHLLSGIGAMPLSADERVVAMVDDRCDPCLKFTSLPEIGAFLPVRRWDSEEYMSRPPEGLNVRVCGLGATKLYEHLHKDVSYLFENLKRFSHSFVSEGR